MADIHLDFETFYDTASKYSLSSMTTEEYVRDPRFEPILLSVEIPDEDESYYVVGETEIAKELDRLELRKHWVWAHNNMFDGFILGDHYGIECGDYGCTLAMARPMHGIKEANSLAALAKRYKLPDKGTEVVAANGMRLRDFTARELEAYGRYGMHDNFLCRKLKEILEPRFLPQDLIIISETLHCFCWPLFEVDIDLLEAYIPRLAKEQEERVRRVAEIFGINDPAKIKPWLSSNQKFAMVLEAFGLDVPMKDSKTAKNEDGTPKQTYALAKNDLGFKALLEHEDDDVRALAEARAGEKSTLNRTRAQRFIGIGERGRLPVPLRPFGTACGNGGRWAACEKINMQNLSKRQGDKTLRQSMKAPRGRVVMTCDLAQIEARRMADHAGQTDLVEQFLRNLDPYSIFATFIYGYEVSKHNKETTTERNVGKECILSLGYGAWWESFQLRLRTAYGIKLSDSFAEEIVVAYRDRHDRIVDFWGDCDEAIHVMLNGGEFRFGVNRDYTARKGRIILPDGAELVYEDLRQEGYDEKRRPIITCLDRITRTRKKIYRGIIANNCTQGSAARIIQWQIAQLRKEGISMAGTVHDELIFLPRFGDVLEYKEAVEYWMSRGPGWASGTPIACELTLGPTYGDQYDYDVWRTKEWH